MFSSKLEVVFKLCLVCAFKGIPFYSLNLQRSNKREGNAEVIPVALRLLVDGPWMWDSKTTKTSHWNMRNSGKQNKNVFQRSGYATSLWWGWGSQIRWKLESKEANWKFDEKNVLQQRGKKDNCSELWREWEASKTGWLLRKIPKSFAVKGN